MYQFTTEQLHKLLIETIELSDEYKYVHGFTVDAARVQAALDAIEGLDAERELVAQGERLKLTQVICG